MWSCNILKFFPAMFFQSLFTVKELHALPHSLHSKPCFQKRVQFFTRIFFHATFKLCIIITNSTLDFLIQGWPGKGTSRSVPFSGDDGMYGRRHTEGTYRQHLDHVSNREHESTAWECKVSFAAEQHYLMIFSLRTITVFFFFPLKIRYMVKFYQAPTKFILLNYKFFYLFL